MAQLTGTTDTFRIGTGGGLREDLEDKIWDLWAEENFLQTNLSRVAAEAVYHEWVKDSLTAATNVPEIEGDDASFTTVPAPTRAGNYCQITKKEFLISGTLEVVSKAGRARESARQAMKQMREWKNDLEFALIRNAASSAGGSGTAYASAGMESWLATNEILGTTTSSATTAGFAAGVVPAPTDGTTTGAFTEGHLKSAVQGAWTEGGNARIILVNTSQKGAIDAFPGQATRFVDVTKGQQASIVGAANLYVSSVAVHTVVLHRHVRATVALAIDPEYWAIAFLRTPFMEQLAKTGDGHKYHIVGQWTLVSRNEKASAKVVALS